MSENYRLNALVASAVPFPAWTEASGINFDDQGWLVRMTYFLDIDTVIRRGRWEGPE